MYMYAGVCNCKDTYICIVSKGDLSFGANTRRGCLMDCMWCLCPLRVLLEHTKLLLIVFYMDKILNVRKY